MNPTIADEYPIRLSTGELIQIAEFDEERSPELVDKKIRAALDGLLRHCTFVSREIMEETKAGYDARFKPLLRAPPFGCMLKAEPHQCGLMNECAMAFAPVCTLRNISGPKPLPICWEYSPPPTRDPEVLQAASDVGSVIGHAWRRGLYVVVVTVPAVPAKARP